jgi:hypothetical protein
MKKYEVMNMCPMTHHIRKFTLCSVMFAAALSSFTGGLRAQSIGSQPSSQSSHGSHRKDWLDIAVRQKHCPSTPINVPPHLWKSGDELRGRITISGNNLKINGTDDPDHIVVAAGNGPHAVSVAWNGEYLGDFGPISGITVEGNGGDDALIVESGLRLSAIIDGGAGDNCIQGGSGGDQLLGGSGDDVLIAGTGRPALKAGSGRDRIVVPQRMGTLRFAPDTDKDVLALLDNLYDLEPLGSQTHSAKENPSLYDLEPLESQTHRAKETPSPILLGVKDLENLDLSRLQQTYAAGQAVVITNVTQADAEKLRLLLGHPNSISAPNNPQTGLGSGAPVPVVIFRKAPRPVTSAHQYHTGYIVTLDGGLSDRMIEHISQIFSKNEIIVHPPAIAQTQAVGGTPSTDLQNLADSYISDAMSQNSVQTGVKVSNSVWGVRSFLNSSDFYYVFQETDFWIGSGQRTMSVWGSNIDNLLQYQITNPNLLQPSPASTNCTQSTTSGMSWNVGGSAGWNQTQGANATLTGGVSVSNSTTVSCAAITIENQSDPGTGETEWSYVQLIPDDLQQSNSFYSQWIWGIPFSSYQSGQTSLQFQSTGSEVFLTPLADHPPIIPAQLISTIPLPFGDTFKLQQAVVSSVSPASVKPGDNFTITGTGLYPSLVTSVVIGGESVPVTQYSTTSDTQIQVITPNQSGCNLPVVVQTEEGVSNDNVSINISGNSCQ